ncbi:MAG: tetratricopeptide repeat protein [Planctomycetaceae bacterium]
MALDPYSLCPCGSGKKLKFCCTDIVNDMLKALQLHEGGQSRAALKILQKLHAQEPGRAWPATSLAGILLFLEEPAQAREALVALLQDTPDHPLGRVLDATARSNSKGLKERVPRSTGHSPKVSKPCRRWLAVWPMAWPCCCWRKIASWRRDNIWLLP